MIARLLRLALLFPLVVAPMPAAAAEALVAVAANFAEPMETIRTGFEAATGHTVTVSVGSSGKLYAQIVNGAPFDVFLSADQLRPRRLAEGDFALPATRFTYARGRLALWSADPARIGPDGAAVLAANDWRHLAIPNPALAPYGLAARDTLLTLKLWERLRPRIVIGENVGQAFAMVAGGNAEIGLVALSHVVSRRNERPGSHWEVPARFHDPIRQDAILLKHGADNPAAHAFIDFLAWPETRSLIARFGYGTD